MERIEKGNIKPRCRSDIAFSLSRHQRHIDRHIFGEDAVTRGGIVDEDVGHSSHDLVALNDGATAHECGQVRTTNFVIFFIKFLAASSSSSVGNRFGKVFAIFIASYFELA